MAISLQLLQDTPMRQKLTGSVITMGLLLLLAFRPVQEERVTVYLIGDSTMANKLPSFFPQAGWGMPFVYFFNETVQVENRAVNGISTKTFLAENRWQPVVENLRKGDYVLIQFGHNDEVKTKKSYTPEEEFKANLAQFIRETQGKQALPILLTPVARRSFDAAGQVTGTHDTYSALVRQVAQKQRVALIDLDKTSQALYQRFGREQSKHLFNHLAPGEHPNYPDGIEDNTHFNEYGARLIAQLVLQDIKSLNLELASRLSTGRKRR